LTLLQKGQFATFLRESGRRLVINVIQNCFSRHKNAQKSHQSGKELFVIFENQVIAVESSIKGEIS